MSKPNLYFEGKLMMLPLEIDSLSSPLQEVLTSPPKCPAFFFICHISVISYDFAVCARVRARMHASPP